MSSTYDLRFSQLGLVTKYIAALDVDTTALLQQQDQLNAEVASLRAIKRLRPLNCAISKWKETVFCPL